MVVKNRDGVMSQQVTTLAISITSGLALLIITKLLTKDVLPKKYQKYFNYKYYFNLTDDLFQVRYEDSRDTPMVYHNGYCHCKRVKFRIKSHNNIIAIDTPSKIRFPRIILKIDQFELLCDNDILSMYPVYSNVETLGKRSNNNNNNESSSNDNIVSIVTKENKTDNTIGIYSFCSFCGVQIVYSPSLEPNEIMVNVDCIDKSTINSIEYTYQYANETLPASQSIVQKDFNKRGSGIYSNTNISRISSNPPPSKTIDFINFSEDETTSESYHSLPGSINDLSEQNAYVYDNYNSKYTNYSNYNDITNTTVYYQLKEKLKQYMPSNDIASNDNNETNQYY